VLKPLDYLLLTFFMAVTVTSATKYSKTRKIGMRLFFVHEVLLILATFSLDHACCLRVVEATTPRYGSDREMSRASKFTLNSFFSDFLDFQNIDLKKESLRKYRRTVFSASDWKIHRSSNRFLTQLLNMPKSHVIQGISNQVLIVTVNAILIVAYNSLVSKYALRLPLLCFPSLPLSLTSSSLGLLLVFRTNAAYSRWKDSRIAWATITSKANSLIRQVVSWFPEKDKSLKTEFVRYLLVFALSLKWRLRHALNDSRLKKSLENTLIEADIEDFMKSKYRWQRATTKLSDIIRRANLLPNVQCHVDKGISDMIDAACVCERIYTTPIPLTYTRHTARFLFLWLLTVPMSLFNEFRINRWAVVPITMLNSILLFGIEELGVQIEEPFSILALDEICDEIRAVGEEALSIHANSSLELYAPVSIVPSSIAVNISNVDVSSVDATIASSVSVPQASVPVFQ